MFTGKIQLSCILNGSVYARDHFPLFFHCSAWMGRVSIGNYQLNKNDSIPSGFNILCDFHICCMKLLFGTTVFPHYVRWFPPQKPPFIEPFRGDPFPSLSQLCHEKNMTTAMGLPWIWSPFWMDFPMAFPPSSGGHEVTVIQQLPGHEARRLWRVGQRRQQHGAAAERRGTVPCGWATGLVME